MTTHGVLGAILEGVPALLWAIIAQSAWRDSRSGRPSRTPVRLAIVSSLMALHYLLSLVQDFVPTDLDWRAPGLQVALATVDMTCIVAGLAVFIHRGPSFILRDEVADEASRGRKWLATNYGTAALVIALVIGSRLVPDHLAWLAWFFSTIVTFLYCIVVTGLLIHHMHRRARRGLWRPGGLGMTRSTDVALAAGGLVLLGVAASLLVLSFGVGLSRMAGWTMLAAHVALGLTFAAIPAVRILGEVVRRFIVATALIAAAVGVYFGVHALTASLTPEVQRLAGVGAALALALLVGPGQRGLRALIDQTMFHRGRRQTEIQAFLHTISPELGALECCRRALAGIARVMGVRGAAIVLRDGEAVVHGDFTIDPVRRVWPRGAAADALPARPFDGDDVQEPLREALVEAEVVGVAPIVSPRRRWGDLLVTTGLLGATFIDDDLELVTTFADQLALLLDGTELLARAVGVERALAHAEKLAAIGELAARIAHEIRNPVTAARSLAQQLSSEPDSPLNAEHARLILTELERVERQIAALLRFARREEFRFEPVELGALVRATLGQLGPRLEGAGIELALEIGEAATARVDPEKIRQVLINLVENAMDALGEANGSRRIEIAVGRENGAATIRIADNGPGVPADALPRLFEPFFSLKTKGTGLGLAIAKRTLEAHGGTIAASSVEGEGASFRLALPLADPVTPPEEAPGAGS